mgnify:CR=1 FL=1
MTRGATGPATVALAERLAARGQYEEAVAEYERLLRSSPTDWTTMNALGDLCVRMGASDRAVPLFRQVGEAYLAVEGPRGELGYYLVSDGTAKPVRWRIRPPSYVNLSAIPKMVEGHLLSDVIAINASIDIVMGEIDR